MDLSTSWNEIVAEPTWQDGVTELSPGRLLLRARDDLPGVTPAMIDWFFANLDRELYLRFHPVDHLHFAWLRGKQPGRYIGATHLTHQRYGGAGPLMRAAITFLDPGEPSETVVCASVHLVDESGQENSTEAARFAHVALARDAGRDFKWSRTPPDGDRRSPRAKR